MQMQLLKPLATGGFEPIIPIYPGSKRKNEYREIIFGGKYQWDAVLEPFTGGGATALYARARYRFLADIAHDIRAIWQSWIRGQWHQIREQIHWYQSMPVDRAWEMAKSSYERGQGHELAATSLVLRKLAFGGVIRCNSAGKLNISMGKGKEKPFLNWEPIAPDPSPGWSIAKSWEVAVLKWRRSNAGETLVILDPPYYLPYGPGTGRRCTSMMTPAYANHKPHSNETWRLATDPIAAVVKDPRATRIVICNYQSANLDQAIAAIAKASNRPLEHWDFGRMGRMNNGNGEAKVMANERLYVLGEVQ